MEREFNFKLYLKEDKDGTSKILDVSGNPNIFLDLNEVVEMS